MPAPKRVAIFANLEEENRAESRRRAAMRSDESLRELAALQERCWGRGWTERPMVRCATWNRLPWWSAE